MPMRLQIFAKEPVAGQVKTRLCPPLSPNEAAAVYQLLLARTLALADRAHASHVVDAVEVWCTPSASAPFFQALALGTGFALREQVGDTLGERMAHALNSALAAGDRAVLIGADCPTLAREHLVEAVEALATHDAVFAPTADGGYALVGLARALDGFDGIRWSTPTVMADTRARLVASRARWHELSVLADVDTPADLTRWLARDPDAASRLQLADRLVGPPGEAAAKTRSKSGMGQS